MTSQIVKKFHADLCHKYGREFMGNVEELHPLVVKIVEETFPYGKEEGARYKEFITSAAADFGAHPKVMRALVPPIKFHQFMCNFAAGIQYVTHKYKEAIPCESYEFKHNLKEYGYDTGEFYAAAIPELKRIVFHPQSLTLFQTMGTKQIDHIKLPGKFRLDEIAVLVGAEELLHLRQGYNTPNLEVGYDAAQVGFEGKKTDNEAYLNSKYEQEAAALLALATRELKLGSGFRIQKT